MADEKNELDADRMPVDAACPEDAVQDCPQETQEELPFLGFVGAYTHGIDAKGRLIIPASFRKPLGRHFAVSPTPDFKAVALYTIEGWQARRDELLSLVKVDARAQRLLDQFSKYSFVDCEMDAQGRLLLPQKICDWRLRNIKKVDVNGATTHIRIVPEEEGRMQDKEFDEEFSDPLAVIAQMQQAKAHA